MSSVAELFTQLSGDGWRVAHPFTEDMLQANALLHNTAATEEEMAECLSLWCQRRQPCQFGKVAASQRRIHFCLLPELDEVHGEEAFADAAFAVEDEVEAFHVVGGLSFRTCAIRGPRVRSDGASSPLGFVDSSADAPSPFPVESATLFSPFPWTEAGGRFRPGRLRGRTTSPST